MQDNRLLIIDDDQDIGELFIDIGESLGYAVIHTDDPDQFKRYVREWHPTVIVTDLQMPNADGITILRFLAAIETPAKIVIISGMGPKIIHFAETIAQHRGLALAATITKPFVLAEVQAILDRLKAPSELAAEALRLAIENDEIQIFLQPKCQVSTGEVVGAEALARWVHPRLGIISPNVFMAIAELGNLTGPILTRVMTQAVAQIKTWSTQALDLPVAINISARDIDALDLPDHLEAICARAGVPCDRIILELIEGSSLDVSADALDVLTRLRIKGFHLSIDDFGTGFSSLLRLRQLPFSELKIDRSFISSIRSEDDSMVIVKTIIAMAASLGMNCVAEGIEDAATVQRLLEWGCSMGQGYYFGRPMPPDQFDEWMRSSGNTNTGSKKAMA
ncbi:MAG: EAL domain-containing protein [Rhodospirillaceae bacterium]|nr:MAG: EAL domain-containing protein [Rhodospirillaceae bacterium]